MVYQELPWRYIIRTIILTKKVARIMKELGIKARPQCRHYNSYKGEIGKICKNSLLNKVEKNNIIT